MSSNFHEGFAEGPVALPSERSTGLVFAGVLVIAACIFRANGTAIVFLAGLATTLAAVSLLAPSVLRPVNVAWFKLGLLLNKVVSPVVMLVLFAVAIVPFGLVMQLCADPLRKRRNAGAESYWIKRGDNAAPSSMTDQF